MTQPDPPRLPAPAAPADAATPSPADDDFGYSAPDYDPAEYRWVPVRGRARYDGWTEEKQRRFIEVLADTGLVGAAAKEVGMTPPAPIACAARRTPPRSPAQAVEAARAHPFPRGGDGRADRAVLHQARRRDRASADFDRSLAQERAEEPR